MYVICWKNMNNCPKKTDWREARLNYNSKMTRGMQGFL